MYRYYHGTDSAERVLDAVVGGTKIVNGFHMTPSLAVARNYGKHVIAIDLESDLNRAHVGLINKEGNFNKSVGNGVEVVLKDDAAITEFYGVLYDAQVLPASSHH